MKQIFFLSGILLSVMCGFHKAGAQCNPPAAATVSTVTSTCINNGSISIHNITGGGGTSSLLEFAITSSSNPGQPLIGYQNDSNFYNMYPGTYTVSVRYNCSGTYSTVLTQTATISGNYQSINVGFSNIITSFCNNGGFTVNATQGYIGVSGHYTYQLVSAQNASQPDPAPVSAVQTSNVFSGLAAGTYYVRVFDDCGNFVTYTVTIPQGTVTSPLWSTLECYMISPFIKDQYACGSPVTAMSLVRFFNNTTNIQYPAKAVMVFPDSTTDTTILAAYPPNNLFSKQYTIDTFINNHVYGPFYVKLIDACGNSFSSYKVVYDTARQNVYAPYLAQTLTCAGTNLSFYNSQTLQSCTTCPVLLSGNTYFSRPQFHYYGNFSLSADSGATWKTGADTFFVPCSASWQFAHFKVAYCGSDTTFIDCASYGIAPCSFGFAAHEVNEYACIGKSGLFIRPTYNWSGYGNTLRIDFTQVPAGQSPLPALGFSANYYGQSGYLFYNSGNDYRNYLYNLVPGKYVYTITDTVCGKTYTDSITISNPHQYSVAYTTTQTCTNANIDVSITNNGYIAYNDIGIAGYNRNHYLYNLINSAGTVVRTGGVYAESGAPAYPLESGTTTTATTITNVPIGTYQLVVFHDSVGNPYYPSSYITVVNPCQPLVDTITITISALDISASLFISCGGSSGTIIANATGGISPYTYELYNGTVAPANLVTTQVSPVFNGLNAGNTYSVRVIDNCGTGTTVSKSFAPYNVLVSATGTGCLGSPLSLTTSAVPGASYSWTKDGSPLAGTTNTYSIASLSAADLGNYTATITIPGCNSFSGSRLVSTAAGCFPLQIKLLSFNAEKDGSIAKLRWVTASEQNSSYFEVQHSTDGSNWLAIGRVKAAGNASSARSYDFEHAAPAAGINYYRLKMTDNDGSYDYSKVNALVFAGTDDVLLLPNPVAETLYITAAAASIDVDIYAAEGKLVARYKDLPGKTGISMKDLAAGVYYIRITNGHSTVTRQVVKK